MPELPTPAPRLAWALVAALALLLAGCTGAPGPQTSVHLVVVIGASANETTPVMTTSVTSLFRDAIASDHAALDVAVDGPSGPVARPSTDLVLRRGGQVEHDADRRATLTDELLDGIGRDLASASGSSGQVDTLGLLAFLGRLPGEVTGVVFTSGLQSVGPLAIDAIGWDEVGSEIVVDAAVAQHLLPDLRRKTIVFSGIGDVAGAQPRLPDSLRERVVGHWLGLCRAAGGTCSVDEEPLPAAVPVSTVAAPVVEVPSLPSLALPTAGVPLVLPSAALFGPDSTVLLPGAAATLTTFARSLPTGARVQLDGRTATVPPADSARSFSLRRAQACADVLVAAGVPADHVSVHGLGYDQPLTPDVDAQGRLVPEAAALNRSVTVTVTSNGGPSE